MPNLSRLELLPTIARIILKPFTIRVHAAIARFPWARLWYLCRGFDPAGRGIVDLSADVVCQLLIVSRSSLYEWLREGRSAGAFRSYQFKGNRLRVILGGLLKICAALKLQSWGAVSVVPLEFQGGQVRLRAIAVAATTADLQSKSHFAARRALKKRDRIFTPPTADEILASRKVSSEKPERGQIPFLLWVGKSKVFVSKSFVPFGTSQQGIATELGIGVATVQRHQEHLGLKRRQLCQAKHAYQLIQLGIRWESDGCYAEPDIWFRQEGDGMIRLFEPNGISSSSQRQGGHPIKSQRFFRYWGKTWLYRCNLYAIAHIQLTSMKSARHRYKKLIEKIGRAAGESP